MNWSNIKLGELTRIRTGKLDANAADEDGKYPFFTCAVEPLLINTPAFDCKAVLVAGNGDLNVKYYEGKFNAYQRTYVIESKDTNKLHSKYLYYFLSDYIVELREMSIGGVIKYIKLGNLTDAKIPLPPLAEQKRIAAILDKANEIKAKRELALVKFDELAQSIFIEMFGDPITNSHNLPMYKLGDIGVLERGVSKHRPRNAKELMGSDYPLIQTGDVANCAGYIFNHSYAYSELGLKQSKLWEAGTLCITIAANIAKTGILTFDACFPDSIVGFKAKNQATVEYVRVWLMFLQKTLEDNAPESAQKNINLSILRALEIPLPNIDQQVAFHKFLMAVKDKKEILVKSRQQIISLNKSLQEQAFKTGFNA